MVSWESGKEPNGLGGALTATTDKSDVSAKRTSRDITTDESISILDPRRFTPSLHANLVSEILSLRRDQDDKIKLIESLEASLHTTKVDHESLQQTYASVSKETRSLQRQMSLLEGGTSSALGELSRERDDAVEANSETKKRLDVAQKKLRSQEDSSQRLHDQWEKEKQAWENEKRKYERKLHVAESRLKGVLEEVTAFQTAQVEMQPKETVDKETDHNDDAASIRTMSLTNSVRFSTFNNLTTPQPLGNSLADELSFEADDSEYSDEDTAGSVSVHNSPKPTGPYVNKEALENLEGSTSGTATPTPSAAYTDTGVQYSPPPSPMLSQEAPRESAVMRLVKNLESGNAQVETEIEANQRRKRSQAQKPLATQKSLPVLASTAAQTGALPLSPPWTPQVDEDESGVFQGFRPAFGMVSTSTQTEQHSEVAPIKIVLSQSPAASRAPSPSTFPIPTISVQPPTSRPTTPRSPRLPPHSRNFGCQVNIAVGKQTTDTGVQTEGIQVDKRIARLPVHLQPSSITSRPSSPAEDEPAKSFTPIPGNRVPARITSLRPGDVDEALGGSSKGDQGDSYVDNVEEQPYTLQKSAISRPRRISSMFSSVDSSDEGEDFVEADASDSEYRTALSAPKPFSNTSRRSKRSSFGTNTTSPETGFPPRSSTRHYKPFGGIDLSGPFGALELASKKHDRISSKVSERSSAVASVSSDGIRKAAMINHQTRSRSPSLQDSRNPPYPIPTRDSSKRVPNGSYTLSEGRSSPSIRGSYSGTNVRRVRSAAALAKTPRYRRYGSRSPPPLSVSTEAPESPELPPLPQNDLTGSYGRDYGANRQRRHRHELSTQTNNTQQTYKSEPVSLASSTQSSGVVDAIAQTMVGEWMFKYVRRRKSFNVPETNGKDDSGNDRHKRWVWLAPYERSILWSSKQPSSGSALMGKTGRKLVIQSVLDVKDDNPAPKLSGPIFNRSILILTPQRALKFTATTAERHYLWLTALSFLAHSSQAVPEIVAAPQPTVKPQQPLPEFELPAKSRKAGLRDSIRLAKGRSSGRSAPPSATSMPSAPSSRTGDALSYRMPASSGTGAVYHLREDSREAAVPPMIARFSDRNTQPISHGRKRSNTGGHIPPPLSFRGFSGPAGSPALTDSTAYNSADTGASDMNHSQASSHTTWGIGQPASQRTSEASSRPGNFFDAVGTVRMEAFISPLAQSQAQHADDGDDWRRRARRRSKEIRRRNSRSRQRDSYSRGIGGYDDYYRGSRTAGEEEYLRDDPFKGF